MEDQQIIQLYLDRSEAAIAQTAAKYGNYCHSIAYHILHSFEDSEECVNDTYWKTWNLIPPRQPKCLGAFLGKLTRNLSLDRYRRNTAQKRGGGELAVALEELEDCISAPGSIDAHLNEVELLRCLNDFLKKLPAQQRIIFLQRYWYICPIQEIATDLGLTESNVKTSLLRSRKQLRAILEKEGITL